MTSTDNRFIKTSGIWTLIMFSAFSSFATQENTDTTLYHEPYRPQYHFTPAHRWIGDPCGLMKRNGRYLAYSWGGAESYDLVHWRELNANRI